MTLLNYELDFVNLRSESYAETSRIPSTTIGTPIQDAVRRDFTCNALFYNLNLRTIEDFTGSGLLDLSNKVLRTPVSAKVTFKDDPLRLIRGIRFAGRLGFVLDDGVIEAGRDQDVRIGLVEKVSRERIGKEVSGFFTPGGNPGVSYKILQDLDLVKVIYDLEGWGVGDSGTWVRHIGDLCEGLEAQEVRLLYLCGPLARVGGGEVEEVNKNGTKRMVGVAGKAVRDGLKMKAQDATKANVITGGGLGEVGRMIGMVEEGGKPGRLEVGEWVRKGKEDWRVMVRLAAAVRVEERGDMEKVKGAVKGLEDIVVKGERDEDHWDTRPGLQLFTKLTSPSILSSPTHPPHRVWVRGSVENEGNAERW